MGYPTRYFLHPHKGGVNASEIDQVPCAGQSGAIHQSKGAIQIIVDTKDKAMLTGKYADEKKGIQISVIELKGLTDIADYFVIAGGTSERHVRTIAEHVEKGMKEAGIRPYSVEGYQQGRWVIIDYQNVIVHIFLEQLRELYDLESLWIEAKRYRIERENTQSEVENGQRKA
jgi:ribosome-associated protein